MGIAEYSTGNRQEKREKATSSLLCFVPPSAISLSCRISSAATESQKNEKGNKGVKWSTCNTANIAAHMQLLQLLLLFLLLLRDS
jgi:hypothetical protein